MASDNIAAKKKRSFTEVLQSKVWPSEDLFWPSTAPIARVPKWLSGDNRGHVDLQKSKHRIVSVPASGPAAILKHPVGHHFPAKAMGKEQVKGGCLEEVERQSYSTKFSAILSPVHIAPPANQISVKPGLLGSGPLSHAVAAVQGRVVPDGKNIPDSWLR
jgi:hypothetical protein